MTARLVVLAALALAAPGAFAQTVAVTGANGPTPYTLETLSGGDPFAPADPFDIGGVSGKRLETAVNVNVGFSYIRPYWANRGLDLRVPAGSNPAVPVISPYGNLANDFGFVPRVDLSYDTPILGLGASAQFLAIGGNLNRTVAVNGGSAELSASNNLTILVLTFAEINKPFALTDVCDHPFVYRLGLERDTLIASLGTRYTSIRQDFHATLSGGSANAVTDANQTFNGLGFSAGLSTDHPIGTNWGVYSINKAALLLGQNNRKTTATGVDVAGPFANTLTENKTTLFPTVEVDLGVRYSTYLDNRPSSTTPGAVLTVRAGVTGMYYSNVGFLPAAPGTATFDNRGLWLVGFAVLAGVDF